MRKIVAILATLAMAVAFALPAFAASGITPEEQALLDRFVAGVTLKDGTVVKPGAKYIAAIKACLKVKDMDAADIAKAKAEMDKLEAMVIADDYHVLGEFYLADNYQSYVSEISSFASELGFKVTPGTNHTGGNPEPTVYYKDPDDPQATLVPVYGVGGTNNGGTNNGGKGSVKQTGVDMTATVVTVVALFVVLSGSAVVIGKKKLLAD
ncbi:MAG: hypothetical protein IIY93_03450 [Clostridia bacterium]|nr:hypothetical protein [Clostridia bacterium]MBQ1555849.1 hypothetical protein [Clostridia bacterium]